MAIPILLIAAQVAAADRLVTVPEIPYPVYVVREVARDERTPRERCWDAETARLNGAPTDLDRRMIDLKCSQR